MGMFEEVAIDLSDSEWMSLIDGSDKRGGLTRCCANISELRDEIMSLARNAGDGVFTMHIERFKVIYGQAADSHDLTSIPALAKLVAQLGISAEDVEHVQDALRERL